MHGQGNYDLPRFIQHEHQKHDKFVGLDKFQTLLQTLAGEERMTRGAMDILAEQTGIKKNTLRTWRFKLKSDPGYQPLHSKPRPGRAALPPHVVKKIISILDRDYISQNRYLPPLAFRQLVIRIAREAGITQFKASRVWRDKFLRDHGLSIRKPHLRRRTAPDDLKISTFLDLVDTCKVQYPARLIFNADETCWRVFNGKFQTVTRRGNDEVFVLSKTDPKDGLTILATIDSEGDKYPLWLIAKGKTCECEEKYRQDCRLRHFIRSGKLIVKHSENGWSTSEIACSYLKWLSADVVGGRHAFLMWDVHASHRSEVVRQRADNLGIGLAFIPPGQTGEWQPLDRGIFGGLKTRAQAMLDSMMIERDLREIDLIDALVILCESWEMLDTDVVKRAWSKFL